MASYVTLVVALMLAVNAVNGLRCYTCNSQDNVACGWGLTSFTFDSTECQTAGFLDSLVGPKCYKIKGKDSKGNEYVARGCQNPPAFGCEVIAKTAGVFSNADIECYTCETEKCNSASKLTGFTVFGLVLAIVAFLI